MFRRRHKRAEPVLTPIESKLQAITISERLMSATVCLDELPATIGLTDLYASTVSSFPLLALMPGGEPFEPQPLAAAKPDSTEEQSETIDNIVRSLVDRGNAYALIAGSWPAMTYRVVNPDTVAPVIRTDDPRAVEYWLVDGNPVGLDGLAHWKVRDNPRKGPLGRSPLRDAAGALIAYTAAYEYLAGYFVSGGVPSSILKFKQAMDPDAMREHIDEWITARRERRPAGMPPSIDLEVPQASSELAMVQNVLDSASAEIGRVFNAPPSITNAAVAGYSLTYSNVTDDLKRWIALSLRPMWLKAIEQGFTRTWPEGVTAHLDTTAGPIGELIAAATVQAVPSISEVSA